LISGHLIPINLTTTTTTLEAYAPAVNISFIILKALVNTDTYPIPRQMDFERGFFGNRNSNLRNFGCQ